MNDYKMNIQRLWAES